MKTEKVNDALINSYFMLLKNLSPDDKLALIAKLSTSMRKTKKTKDTSWKSLFGALVLDESADDFIANLKADRVFSRESIDL